MTHISKGNMKLDATESFSLMPLQTCSPEACATCGKDCYAMKAVRCYPSVRKAWGENTFLARHDLKTLEANLTQHFTRKRPDFFRIHVGGDFLSKDYYLMWCRIAERFPQTSFMAFTKRFDIVADEPVPENLEIIYSAWPGMQTPPSDHRVAWMQDGTETRVPENAFHCNGHCSTCRACWNLTTDVVFAKH